MIISPKNTLHDDIFCIIEKNDIYLRKYSISSDRKTIDDKKVYFNKKVPMILGYFYGDLSWRFPLLLSNEKNRKLDI